MFFTSFIRNRETRSLRMSDFMVLHKRIDLGIRKTMLSVCLWISIGLLIPLFAQETIEVAVLKGPTGFGAIYLIEEKPVLSGNVSTHYDIIPTPQEMVARIASQEVDVALLPINLAAKLYRVGPGYKLGAITGLGMLFVLTNDAEIDSWDDLRGRRIHSVGKGATPDYLFRYLAEENGLQNTEDYALDFTYNAAPQLVKMLIAGKVTIAQLPEPFATQARLKGADVSVLLDLQDEWRSATEATQAYPMSALVVKPSFANRHPQLVRELLDLYDDSIERVNAEPNKSGELIGQHGILPAALATPAIPNCNLEFVPAYSARASVEQFLSVLLDFDPVSIGGYLPDEGFYFR